VTLRFFDFLFSLRSYKGLNLLEDLIPWHFYGQNGYSLTQKYLRQSRNKRNPRSLFWGSSVCVVTPNLHQAGMTRLRKRAQHCRRISRLRFENNETESGSDSDDIIEIADDGFRDETIVRSVEEALKWVKEAYCRSRKPYQGNNGRTIFRQQAEKKRRLELAKTNMKITSFFGVQTVSSGNEAEDLDPSAASPLLANVGSLKLTVQEAIEKLRLVTQNTPNVTQQRRLQKSTNEWQFMCLLAIRQYFQKLQQESGKIRTSEEISKYLFPDTNSVHQGRLIRQWADHHLNSGSIPESRQGRLEDSFSYC